MLDLSGVTIKNPILTLRPDLAPQTTKTGSHLSSDVVQPPDMLIGMNILSHLHVYIAYKERKLYITPSSPPAKADSAVPSAQSPAAQ